MSSRTSPTEATVETLETQWWQPLSCGCDPSVEALETALETEWWQPLSCACDPSIEH